MTIPTLAWLDFAERDRRRMLDVIKLFREQDTRDELGIGSVRDAFAELLFPGTSTIMTRARYFLLIPWLYIFREEHAVSYQTKTPVPEVMRLEEIWMISRLERGGEERGVIGIEARRNLKRLPSSIYWNGLGRWGIRRMEMSIPEYHRFLSHIRRSANEVWRDDDGEPVAGYATHRWDPALPKPPSDWRDRFTFDLTREEAEYLRERILTSCPDSLLAHLVDRARPVDASVAFPWMHPQLASFPPRLRQQIEHARLASLVMNGAAWLYNVLLAEAKGDTERSEEYRQAFAEWAVEISSELHTVAQWDLDGFWILAESMNAGIAWRTKRFVTSWTDRVRSIGDPALLIHDVVARDLIAARERELKRSRSRLDNQRLLDLWNGPSGTARLNYRWNPVVRNITNDIIEGLARPGHDDA
jgi:hypothetical protein